MATENEGLLHNEFDYYLAHQAEIVAKYDGRVVVIKGGKVLGDYDDQASAIADTVKTYPLGTFLVQRVTPGDSAYTQTFHSRVAFSSAR